MIELTFAEVKHGLLCCTVNRCCTGCPLYRGDDLGPVSAGDLTCSQMLMAAAFKVIKTMEQDLADAWHKADLWEETATTHEKDLINLRESLDRRGEE